MHDIGKRSAFLENVAGCVRLDAYIYINIIHIYIYIYVPVTKWQHWGMFIHWGNKRHVPRKAL